MPGIQADPLPSSPAAAAHTLSPKGSQTKHPVSSQCLTPGFSDLPLCAGRADTLPLASAPTEALTAAQALICTSHTRGVGA